MVSTILQLSDIHLTATPGGPLAGIDPDRRLQVVLDAWRDRDEPVDLVVLSGDNADDASSAAYDRLVTALAPLRSDVLAVSGNHDSPVRLAVAFGPPVALEIGWWRVLGLDSSRPAQVHGTIDGSRVAAMLDELDDRPTVLVIHHPPMSRTTAPPFALHGAAGLLAALESRPHVRAVLSGHVHDPFEFTGSGGVALLGCPSSLVAFQHCADGTVTRSAQSTGARIVRLHGDGSLDSELILV